MKGFFDFIREQGVVGLAVGFLLGGAVSKLVSALINDLVNPLVGPILGFAGNLKDASFTFGPVTLLWGDFVANFIDFGIIAAVVYFGVRGLGLDKLDKAKQKAADKAAAAAPAQPQRSKSRRKSHKK